MPTNAVALTRLLLSERPSLLRLAQRIVGNLPAAEDVTQSLWLRVQRVEDHPPISNKRAYLYTLARRLAADHAKADRRRGAVLVPGELPADVPDEAPSVIAELLDREALECVSAALREMQPRWQRALWLRRVEGKSVAEIAVEMGVSRQMVARYIAQAVEECLDRLEDDDA